MNSISLASQQFQVSVLAQGDGANLQEIVQKLKNEQCQSIQEKAAQLRFDIIGLKDEKALEAFIESNLQPELARAEENFFTSLRVKGVHNGIQQKEIRLVQDEMEKVLKREVEKLQKMFKYVKKLDAKPWLKDIGLTAQTILDYPDFMEFFFKSWTVFYMGLMRYSSDERRNLHILKQDKDGHPLLLTMGKWVPWRKINQELEYNEATDRLYERANPSQGWNYDSFQGLVRKDRTDYPEIYPIDELNQTKYEKLLEHAKKFYTVNPDLDPQAPKTAVFQIASTYRKSFMNVHAADAWYAKNVLKNIPTHITVRLIDKDRKVYSFGIEPKRDVFAQILKKKPFHLLKTIYTKIATIDLEESKEFETRMVTSIALSDSQAQSILKRVNELNQKTIRFNFMKQNCSKLGSELLATIGIDVPCRINLAEFFWNFVPDLQDVPYVGKPLHFIREIICTVANAIFSLYAFCVPECVQRAINFVATCVFMLPNALLSKISTIIANIFIYNLGADLEFSPLAEGREDVRESSHRIVDFTRPIRSWQDFFRDDSADYNYSQKIVEWQKAQPSTFVHKFENKPKLYMIPN